MNQEQLLAKRDELVREYHLGELELYCTPRTFRERARFSAWDLDLDLAWLYIIVLVAVCITYVLDFIANRTSVYVYTNGLVFFSRKGGRVVPWEEIRKVGIHYDSDAHPVTIYAELNNDNKIWFPESRSRDSASDKVLKEFIEEKIQRAETARAFQAGSPVESNPYFPIPSENAPPQPSVYATYATTSAGVRQEETKRKAGSIILSIVLYLWGALFAMVGFYDGVLNLTSESDFVVNTSILCVIVSIVILILVLRKHKRPHFHAKQQLSIVLAATVGGYILYIVLLQLIRPMPDEVWGSFHTVYGVVVAIVALW